MHKNKLLTKFSLIAVLFCFTLWVQAREIMVYDWDGYYDLALVKQFEEQTNIKVKHQILTNDQELIDALNSPNPIDLIVTPHYLLPAFIKGNYIQELNHKKISNYQNLDKNLLIKLAKVDLRNQYAVPYVSGVSLIVLKNKMVQQVLGKKYPKSWNLLFDPEYAEKLNSCGVGLFEAPQQLYNAYMFYKGVPLASINQTNLMAITDDLIALKSNYRQISNEGVAAALKENKLCAAFAWSSFMAQMGHDLELIVPEEGVSMYIDVMVIPTKATNSEDAYQFIEFMLQAENAAHLLQNTYGIPAVKGVKELVPSEYANNPLIFPDYKTLTRMFLLNPLDERMENLLNNEWHRFINH